jgi:clan AA aspartic protease
MEAPQVTVTIRNPDRPDNFWEGLFLLDTGVMDSPMDPLVPRKHLKSIGLSPKTQRIYELADGSEIKMDITTADIEFMRDLLGGNNYLWR